MSSARQRLHRFVAELRRRKVFRVFVAYVIVGWLVIQVVETTWEALHLPPGTLTFVIVLIAAVLPLVLVLAWLFDVVPDHHRPRPRSADGAAHDSAAGSAPGEPLLRRHDGGPSEDGPAASRPLPNPGTPFFGREAERSEIVRLLASGDGRLVTLVGPGGVGKSRLALEVARACHTDFPHGAVLVPLSGLPSAELLPAALAEALQLSPSRRGDLMDQIIDFLRAKRMLIVLDNLEHLLDGNRTVVSILEGAPDVRLIATSRERLNLRQEAVLAIGGLPLGSDERSSGAALELFAAAAHRVDSTFILSAELRADVERICTLVSGLPLAIELAASWVRVLSCREIVAELERGLDFLSSTAADVPQRHRSLRATFDSSWRLLSEAERRALMRVSVFRSAFDREAAREVADTDATLLRALVDKSLVAAAAGRFHLLDLIRQYAAERLAEQPDGQRVASDRHLRYFSAFLAVRHDRLRRFEPGAVTEVAAVIDEIRAAWRVAGERLDSAALGNMLDGLFCFYEARGWAREGHDTFFLASAALEIDAQPANTALRGRLDVRRGVFCDRLGEHDHAGALLRGGLAIARRAGSADDVIFALNKYGANRLAMGEYDAAAAAHNEASRLAAAAGNRAEAAWATTHLGNVSWARGDYEHATRLYNEALRAHRDSNDRNGLWIVLNNLGVIAGLQRKYQEANRRFAEALDVQMELGNKRSAALLHHNIGYNSRLAGGYEEARRHLEAARELADEMGYRPLLAQSLSVLAELALQQDDRASARLALLRSLEIAAAARNYPVLLQSLLTYARLRIAEGDTSAAFTIAHVVLAHPASEQEERDAASEMLEQLGGDAAAAAAPTHAEAAADELVTSILAEESPAIASLKAN